MTVMRLADRYTDGDCKRMSCYLKEHPDFEVWYRRRMVEYLALKHPVVVASQLRDLVQRLGSFERALSLYDLRVPALETIL